MVLGAHLHYQPLCTTMEMITNLTLDLGKRGAGNNGASSPARWVSCGLEGKGASSSSYFWKIATWNVRSLWKDGKQANVCKEMDRIGIDILGISETFWTGKGDFTYNLPNGKEFKIMYSGGEKRRKGVAVIVQGKLAKSVINYQAISERHITIKIESKPRNIFINQVYAPTSDSSDQDKKPSMITSKNKSNYRNNGMT